MNTKINLAIGLLVSTSAFAQEGTPVKVRDKAQQTAGKVADKAQDAASNVGDSISTGLNTLQEEVLAGKVTPAAFDGMKAQIRQLGQGMAKSNPNSVELGQRLERRVADLQQRATNGNATAEDFAILREQVVDTRLDNAISQLAANSEQAQPSREEFGKIANLLKARAEATATIDPQGAQESQKVIRAFSGLEKKAGKEGLKPADFSSLRSQLAEARLDRAMSDLQNRAVAKNASPADYARVNEVLADRTAAIGTPAAEALQERLANAIDKLKAKAAAGDVTPEEFKAVRDNLVKKAREAAAGSMQHESSDMDHESGSMDQE